jgi:ribose transport system permease protein
LVTGSAVLRPAHPAGHRGAAVIGGVSLFGGRGKVLWTVYGRLFLTVVDMACRCSALAGLRSSR